MHVQVRDAAQAIDPGLVAIACGSYRRGKATCGDVDVLISHPDGRSHRGIFTKVLQTLRDSGKHHFCWWEKLKHVFYFIFFNKNLFISDLFTLRVFNWWPGEPRGERWAEEIHGCVPFAGAWPTPSQAGYHHSALQWVCLCSDVFHWFGTL